MLRNDTVLVLQVKLNFFTAVKTQCKLIGIEPFSAVYQDGACQCAACEDGVFLKLEKDSAVLVHLVLI